jgi:hypothetical protein
MAVPCKVTRFSTIEAWSFGAQLAWDFFLQLGGCCVGIHIVTNVLSAVVGGPNAVQVHWNLHVIVGWSWCIGRIVYRSLLLLLLLWLSPLVLLTISPGLWLELVSVLAKSVVEWMGVQKSSSRSDELYHLSSFRDFDSLCFVFGVGGWEWCSYNFI